MPSTEAGRQYSDVDTTPLVSIITPAYNRASYLDETIQSVLNQDYPHVEYIVLDDGSTDNTREVLEKYTGRIIRETHTNMGEARTVNKGWSMARGEIIAVVNSDDPLLPGAVSAAVAFLQSHPDVLVAYPDWNYIGPDSKITGHVRVPEYNYLRMLRQHYCAPGPGAFIRRKAIELAGMRDPEFKYVGDFEYWLRLGLYGEFARIPRTLATFRVHPASASVSSRGTAMADEHISLIKKFYSRPDLPPEVQRVRAEAFSSAHLTAAACCKGARRAALRHCLRAIDYHAPSVLANLNNLKRWGMVLSFMLPEPLAKFLFHVWYAARSTSLKGRTLLKRNLSS